VTESGGQGRWPLTKSRAWLNAVASRGAGVERADRCQNLSSEQCTHPVMRENLIISTFTSLLDLEGCISTPVLFRRQEKRLKI